MQTQSHPVIPRKPSLQGRRGTSLLFAIVLFSSTLFCSLALARKNPPTDAELALKIRQAPAETASWRNPFEGRADAVAAGKKLFKRHCAECHAEENLEESHAADLRSPVIQNAAPGILVWLLKNGNRKDGMPSWSALPEEQRWQIVSYLKSLGPAPRTAGEGTSLTDARR